MLQDDEPVAFASKALTNTERRDANIEREMLAVVYRCERFHIYLSGHNFSVHSDHKLLKSIHLEHLTAAPPRLQQMLLRLQPYDLVIKYQPGKTMEIADALSRLSPEETGEVKGMDVQIHEICPQFSNDMTKRIKSNDRIFSYRVLSCLRLKNTIFNVESLVQQSVNATSSPSATRKQLLLVLNCNSHLSCPFV